MIIGPGNCADKAGNVGQYNSHRQIAGNSRRSAYNQDTIMKRLICLLLLLSPQALAQSTPPDGGYRLWLKYDCLNDASKRNAYGSWSQFIVPNSVHPTLKAAAEELQTGLSWLLDQSVPVLIKADRRTDGLILEVTARPDSATQKLNEEGYIIAKRQGNIVISGTTEKGVLYGAFAWLRYLQTGQSLDALPLTDSPKVKFRMLNHWDYHNGTVERGYAGESLWKWYELPERIDPRYRDYARANASIGINGTVVNNVNASARFMTTEYLKKVAMLAKVCPPYGIRLYLSVYFAAPKTLGGLPTSDPLDPQVRQWWADKTKEIYALIPDFGGFLVKANSEGEPGP